MPSTLCIAIRHARHLQLWTWFSFSNWWFPCRSFTFFLLIQNRNSSRNHLFYYLMLVQSLKVCSYALALNWKMCYTPFCCDVIITCFGHWWLMNWRFCPSRLCLGLCKSSSLGSLIYPVRKMTWQLLKSELCYAVQISSIDGLYIYSHYFVTTSFWNSQ